MPETLEMPAYQTPVLQQEEQVKKLEELAGKFQQSEVAADVHRRSRDNLIGAGFTEHARYVIEHDGQFKSVAQYEASGVAVSTTVELPRESIIASLNSQARPALSSLRAEFERLRFEAEPSVRFLCGRVWYTLKESLSSERLVGVRQVLCLPVGATPEKVQGTIHFRFQRLYQKPPDDWTDAEIDEWDTLISLLDLNAYQSDNPPTDNRIGRLICASAEQIVIRWVSKGEVMYETRSVPPELLSAHEGWLVHAEFYCGNGAETWLSTRIEPPLPDDAEVIAADLRVAQNAPVPPLADANWPKIKA